MIAFLNGVLVEASEDGVCLNVNGIGFRVFMSLISISRLPKIGEDVLIYTYMQQSENATTLYGFLTSEERTIFEKLLSVSGVGPKIALAALSTYDPEMLARAIVMQDVSAISKIPGIGKKGASRIILELKDKISDSGMSDDVKTIDQKDSDTLQSVREALVSMGFSSSECQEALSGADLDKPESDILKYALMRLA